MIKSHHRYCRRLSPLRDSISFRISCAKVFTGSSTSSSNSPRKGMVSARNTRYSSFRFWTRYWMILRPNMRARTFSLRVCIRTWKTYSNTNTILRDNLIMIMPQTPPMSQEYQIEEVSFPNHKLMFRNLYSQWLNKLAHTRTAKRLPHDSVASTEGRIQQ